MWPGGYPGALRDLLGIRIEEFAPLLDDEEVTLDDGTIGTLWTDRITVTAPDTEVLATYTTRRPQAGRPAVTRRPAGRRVRHLRLHPARRRRAGAARSAGCSSSPASTASCPADCAAGSS